MGYQYNVSESDNKNGNYSDFCSIY